MGFLRNYWGDRTILQRVFDPRGYDYYQGRELSYAVDFLDAQWIRLVLDRGWLFFIPPSALAASLGVVLAWAVGLPRALPGLDRVTAWCLLLVYLSNFAVLSTMGLLYRSAKPLVPPLLLAVLLFVLRELREPRAGPRAAFAWVYVPCLAMSLLDRQGLFYTAGLTAVLAVVWVRTRRGAPLAVAGAASIATWALYNYVVGPWIIHAANGYWPEFRFQRLRPSRLMQPQPWVEGYTLLRDWTSVLLGSLPLWLLALAGAVLLLLHFRWRKRGPDRRDVRLAGLLLLGAAAQVAMVAVMVQRHEPVTWIDHRVWYYPLPFQALLVFALAVGLERVALARGGTLPRLVPVLLALARPRERDPVAREAARHGVRTLVRGREPALGPPRAVVPGRAGRPPPRRGLPSVLLREPLPLPAPRGAGGRSRRGGRGGRDRGAARGAALRLGRAGGPPHRGRAGRRRVPPGGRPLAAPGRHRVAPPGLTAAAASRRDPAHRSRRTGPSSSPSRCPSRPAGPTSWCSPGSPRRRSGGNGSAFPWPSAFSCRSRCGRTRAGRAPPRTGRAGRSPGTSPPPAACARWPGGCRTARCSCCSP